jgi:hypothetical protein
MRIEPSFFFAKMIGAPNGDLLGRMKPALAGVMILQATTLHTQRAS